MLSVIVLTLRVYGTLMPRILIIDDEPLVRSVLRSILERNGHTVVDASNGRDGLELWCHSPSDLLLIDIFMPDVDGIEVIMQLKRVWPRAKIIAMTGGARKSDTTSLVALAARQLGAQHILMKPFTKLTLLAAISTVLNPEERTRDKESQSETPIFSKGMQ
jgi:two-component system, chemotaxis family, chemotaxis protein CheY